MSQDPGGRATSSSRWTVAALLALTALAYANAIDHPFLYDDLGLVVERERLRSLANLPEILGFRDGGFTLGYRWTREVTHALEYAVAGLWAPLYHLVNVLLHALNGWLAFLLVRRISGRPGLAFWAVALFLVHPINTAVVSHVSGRRELLAAAFSLGCLLCLLRGVRAGRAGWLAAGLCLFPLGVWSKELAVMAAPVFGLVHLYAARPGPGGGWAGLARDSGALLVEHWRLYTVLALVALAVTVQVLFFASVDFGLEGNPSTYDDRGGGLSPLDRARLLGLGLRLMILPIGQSTDYFYDALGLARGGFQWLAALDLAVLAAAIAATLLGLSRRRWLGFGGVWFFAFYLPHLGIISWHEVFAERFLYLSSIGFAAAAASFLPEEVSLRSARRPAVAAGLVLVAVLTGATVLRNRVWASPEAFFLDAVTRYPEGGRAWQGLGREYMAQQRYEEALAAYETAHRILGGEQTSKGMAEALIALERWDEAGSELESIIRRYGDDAPIRLSLGLAREQQGQKSQARLDYVRALELDPTLATAYFRLAQTHLTEGDWENGRRLLLKALEVDAAYVPALRDLARLYRRFGREAEAARYESLADSISPPGAERPARKPSP